MFAQSSAAALNHLLKQNSWALPRLARFAGKTARFDIAPFSFAYTILDDGTLRSADAATSADVLCVIAPSLLPRLALSGASARNSLSAEADAKLSDENAHADIRSEGDAELLTEIFFLSRNLRWDVAEDLSRVTGDIAAERIVQAVHSTHQQLRASALNFTQAAAEYWTEERPLLAKPQQVSAFMQQVDTLRDDVARLEQRIKTLSPPSTGSGQAKPSDEATNHSTRPPKDGGQVAGYSARGRG
jgi:ubiquinone biosynthesis protein UbiJ